MINTAMFWLGVLVATVGSLGIFAVLLGWTIDQVCRTTRTSKIIIEWYWDKLRKEKKERGA